MDGLGITVAGQLFRHRLFHFALVYSGWKYADVVLGRESFTSFSSNLRTRSGNWAERLKIAAPTVFLPLLAT